jgi:gluconate 2-dehydrogenase gamma chain
MRTLTAHQLEILEALVETMIPSDELGPGAREAGVVRYVDGALVLAERRTLFVVGLEATDEYARSTFGLRLAALDPERRAAILGDVERNRAGGFGDGSAWFFGMLRALVLEGMFCDPAYGGNADYIGWKLIGYPGHMPVITPEEQQIDAEVIPIYERPGRSNR